MPPWAVDAGPKFSATENFVGSKLFNLAVADGFNMFSMTKDFMIPIEPFDPSTIML